MTVHGGRHNFVEAGEFDQTYRGLQKIILTPEFKTHANIFVASFDRIAALHSLPIQLIAWADHLAFCVAKARTRFASSLDDQRNDQDAKFRHFVHETFIADNRGPSDALTFGATQLEGMLSWEEQLQSGGQATPGVQALFSAMIMGAYVALENLASDLWVEAINLRPQLATNWVSENPKKQFEARELFGRGFDFTRLMGTVLLETHKVTFKSWDGIKGAYVAAFAGALDDAFEPADQIYLAEKTRHLFAHRSGLVDREFKQAVESFPEYKELILGERLRLTGPVVKQRVDACLQCGAKLLKGADQWIQKN